MHGLRQEQQQSNRLGDERERRFPIRVSPTEVRSMTETELEASISEDDIEQGLSLAGAWSDLNIPEEEFFAILERNRQSVEPAPPLALE